MWKSFRGRMSGGHLRPLEWLPLRRECWRPLAATRVAASGCKWLQVAASGCRWQENAGGHLRPLAATRVAASGCKWLPVTRECWRPLAATRLAASGCKWLPVTRECWRPLAATCGHSSGCKWLPIPTSNYIRASCVLNEMFRTTNQYCQTL